VAATEDGPTKTAERAFGRALFGDHPYARTVRSDDLEKITRADVDAWLGRVHNMRAAALVVVGDVDHAEVERGATILSQQVAAPTWVADLPAPPPPATRPATAERLVSVVTPRAGGLTDIRLGCLLPPMRAADRGHYELLKHAVEARLNAALRIEEGDGYGVNASYGRLRDGTAYLVATTFVGDPSLTHALGALRAHWQRWARSGLEPGEVNVARWRYAGSVASGYANPHTLALQLLDQWGTDPTSLKADTLRPDLAGLSTARVNELFATCKANAVLGLTGNEALINHALDQAWPGLRR
jgi:zinc protease